MATLQVRHVPYFFGRRCIVIFLNCRLLLVAGTCEEHGFTVSCYTCRYTMEFLVEEANTCDQAHTDCFFRSEDEECIGSSQCPYAEKKVLRGGIDNNYALFKK